MLHILSFNPVETYLFHIPVVPLFHFFLPDCLQGLLPGPFLLSYSVFYFPLIFSFLHRALD